ncbi:Efflux ABC transporter, ATP-binding protein [hydrothermal vent metagenome]|uniref:Efflux ABC transporter, ATP-binding protein n=1 Tax=hydrothermal vent metagenome TaxID=652676 RepID=A0A3B0ZDK0_9ZZZZ
MSISITVKNIHKSFSSIKALKGINLEIERGEFFGLLGPNGAGKSTLLNIMSGLTRASHGSISILGHDVVTAYRSARLNLGIVPQELVFDPFFTVREVLKIQAGYFGLDQRADAWIDELIDALMLSDKANTNMRALSGGMKRRVLIAQALVHKPPVVVLDEPTAGVDVELRKSLWVFIKKLHREGHTILLTTHYLEEAESLCERIAIMNHGKIIALDHTKTLLDQGIGNHRSATLFFAETPPPLPSEITALISKQEGLAITVEFDLSQITLPVLLNILEKQGCKVRDIKTEQIDLEDVFIDTIQRNEQ